MAIAMETVVYLILAVTVLSVALFFFLSVGGQPKHQFELEAQRSRFCGAYTLIDFECKGKDDKPVETDKDILEGIGSACFELNRMNVGYYPDCVGSASLECIKKCCLTCLKG